MTHAHVNDCELYYEVVGEGDPLVLVHGSLGDHRDWQAVVAGLAQSFRVVTYDRRGHGRSERPLGQGSRREDEDDLAALIEALQVAPANAVGTSFGASVVLGLAGRRPDLFRSLIVHEPPLLGLVADDPDVQPLVAAFQTQISSALEHLQGDDILEGTRRFMEEIDPGMWERVSDEAREMFVHHAPTVLDEQRDPSWAELDLNELAGFSGPALLTHGDQSPPWFSRIIDRLAGALEGSQRQTSEGAHIPHITKPDEFVQDTTTFIREHRR